MRQALNSHRTALLVIDMQKAFLQEGAIVEIPDARSIVSRLKKLIAACKKKGVLVIYTRISHEFMTKGVYPRLWPQHFMKDGRPYLARGTEIFELDEAFQPDRDDIVLDKDRYSAFYGTNLETVLRDRGIVNLIVTGVATNVCCESTARDAFSRDLIVYFVSDCTATLSKAQHDATLETIGLCFGYVTSSNGLIKMLSQTYGRR